MTNEIRKYSEIRYPNKRSIYNEFILWTAMPHPEKVRLGIETQGQFSEQYKINEDTLTNWKKRPDFEQRVDAILKMWSTDKTPDVVHSIYRAAVKGNPMSQLLWLQYFKGFDPKKIEDPNKKKAVLGIGDIRHAIEQLPEQLKEKHYGYLRELAEDLSAVRNAMDPADKSWEEKPPQITFDEDDVTPQSVPSEEQAGTMVMAICYQKCVSENIGRLVSENNYKSAERWW